MDKKTFESLRKIKKVEDVQTEVVYYSDEYERHGNTHYSYCNLYDENFELLESVKVLYTNSIKHLKRIVSEKHKDDYSLAAYTIEPIGNGFCYVISDRDTKKALEAMCESVKPKTW